MSQLASPSPGSRGRAEHVLTYFVFAFFGAGSGWIVVGSVFLELAVYQEQLGLLTSNRCSLGYQAGALCVPLFAAIRVLLQRCGRDVAYRALIVAMACTNLLNLTVAAMGIHSLESIMLVSFLGGSCGYLSGVVHQAYLVLNCEDVYSAAFWAGDAGAGLFAALLATVQRPELGSQGRLFEPELLYCMLMPIICCAMVAFWMIECLELGFLPAKSAARRALLPAGPPSGHGTASAEPPAVPAAGDGDVEAPGDSAASKAEAQSGPKSKEKAELESQPLRDLAKIETSERGEMEAEIELSPLPEAETQDRAASAASAEGRGSRGSKAQLEVEPLKGEAKAALPSAGLLASLLPEGARARPAFTVWLVVLGFWMSLTCWGIGDSMIPYACEQSSKADEGESCLFHTSLGTVAAIMVGSNLAGIASAPLISHLNLPALLYTAAFGLLCLAAWWGGAWARPLVGPVASGIAAGDASAEINAGGYVVLLVVLMRSLQPFVQVTRQRLIQREYAPEDRESMNLFYAGLTVAANILGVVAVTAVLS